jgi:exodeoxyribonuclease V alpha subunit
MHACACCCRSCLNKWHHIKMGKPLTNEEQEYIKDLLMTWIKNEYKKN